MSALIGSLDLKALREVRTIVVHQNNEDRPCPDGTASAVLLHDALPTAEIRFAHHGPAYNQLEVKPHMLFADISPPVARAKEFVSAGAFVLDHHVTTKDVVALFGDRGVYSDEPGQSGAWLAYAHVWLPIRMDVPQHHRALAREHDARARASAFAGVAGVRDTWYRAHPWWTRSCEQAEALAFWRWEDWAAIADPFGHGYGALQGKLEIGSHLSRQRIARAATAAKEAEHRTTRHGTKIAFVNTTDTSDVAELLDVDVLAGFRFFLSEPITFNEFSKARVYSMQVSLRSRDDRYDVGAVAKRFGGGGHKSASGFRCSALDDMGPVERILALFEMHEDDLDDTDEREAEDNRGEESS